MNIEAILIKRDLQERKDHRLHKYEINIKRHDELDYEIEGLFL